MTRKLIVGLGNPGKEYANTPHNAGFLVVDRLSAKLKAKFKGAKESRIAETVWNGQPLVFCEPLTYMNLSGRAVAECYRHFEIEAYKNLLVILDDADLEFGRLRFREKGSSGGQRGLQSVIDSLGTPSFPRLRVGIGRPADQATPLKDYVLKGFTSAEEKQFGEALDNAAEAVLAWIEQGPQVVMNRYNR